MTMTPTAIWITGTYDAHYNTSEIGTDFRPCQRVEATHVSVYLIDDEHAEPVQDFPIVIGRDQTKAYADALTLAASLAHEKTLPIRDTYQNNEFRAPAYPQVELVRGHKHTCANVQPGSTEADVCDCGAVVDGKSVPANPCHVKLIRVTGVYDSNPGSHAPFWEPCHRSKASHVAIFYEYPTGESGLMAKWLLAAYPEALMAAVEASVRLGVKVKDDVNGLTFGPDGVEEKPEQPQDRYAVDGAVYPNDENGPLFQGDGQYPPFVIFDIQAQKNLSGYYQTREAAEKALSKMLGQPERPLRVTDAMYHAFVNATRLQGNESETVKDLVMNGLEAALDAQVPQSVEAEQLRENHRKHAARLISERGVLRDLLRMCLRHVKNPTLYKEIEKVLPCVDEGCPQAGSEHVCTTIAKGAPPKPDTTKYAFDTVQPGMLRTRYHQLQHEGGTLTAEEIAAGWFFDDDYDGLLAHTSWPGHEKDRP